MLMAAKRMMKAFMTGPSDLVSATMILRTALILPNMLPRADSIIYKII